MFESPCKSINVLNAWSESQEELRETQPASLPRGTGKRVKIKKKQRKEQHSDKRSVSAPQLCIDDDVQGLKETKYRPDEPIVRGIFQIGKKSHDVVLTATRVTWTPIQPETPTGELSSAELCLPPVTMVIKSYSCLLPVCLELKAILANSLLFIVFIDTTTPRK